MIASDRDEILIKYAQHPSIIKQSWDWADVAGQLGVDALIGGALGVGKALITKSPVVPAMLGWMGIPLQISNPIGWVLLAGNVAWTIYSVSKQTDDNLEDLINRFEALDPNPKVSTIIEQWMQELKILQDNLKVEEVAKDPEARIVQLGNQVNNLQSILEKLQAIERTWPQIKPNLTDGGFGFDIFDIGQAETALTKTTQAISKQLQVIKQEARTEGTKILQILSQKAGVDYTNIAKKVVDLHNQITQHLGQQPIYETDNEQAAFNLANAIVNGTGDVQNITIVGPSMVNLAKQLEKLFKRVQSMKPKTKPAAKISSAKPLISKRAVRLPGEAKPAKTQPGMIGTEVAQLQDPVVQEIQRAINYLNLNLRTGVARVGEDGNYGSQTSQALYGLLEKVPVLDTLLQRYIGLNKDAIKDANIMKDRRYLVGLRSVLYSIVKQIQDTVAPTVKEPETTEYDPRVQCKMDKENPSDVEILACLRQRNLRDPQANEWVNAYEFLKGKGMNDSTMVQLVHKLFPGWQSGHWNLDTLAEKAVGARYKPTGAY